MDYRLTLITPISSFSKRDMESFFSMLRKQTNQNFECVLVLNGEKHAIEEGLSTLKECKLPSNAKIIIDGSNTYIGGARNHGINNAKSDYISFVDLDDSLNETFVEETFKLLKNNVDAIVYNYKIISVLSDGNETASHKEITKNDRMVSGGEAAELCIRKEINKPCWNKVFNKRVIQTNPFFLNCNGEDYCMPLILKRCRRVYLSNYESYIYFLNSTSSSHKNDFENCFYSLILSALVLNEFGESYTEPIMKLNLEDFYKTTIMFRVLRIKKELKKIHAFYRRHRNYIAGRFSIKTFFLFLLSKTYIGAKLSIRIKKEKINMTRLKSFIDLYLDNAILCFEKFK